MIKDSRFFHRSFWSGWSLFGLFTSLTVIGSACFVLASCENDSTTLNMPSLEPNPMIVPAGFPQPVVPQDNPVTPAKVALGRYLFYETSLSSDGSKSCSSCHSVSTSFSDQGNAVSTGVQNQKGSRNALALVNIAYDTALFWDGRASSLEMQAGMPIMNPVEMGNDSITAVATLSKSAFYRSMFASAFGDTTASGGSITFTHVEQALASFERTLISGSSDYDRFKAGDSSALSASAQRGMALFNDSAVNCVACHSGVNFTDNGFHSTGLDVVYQDIGREDFTDEDTDNGKFLTPSLRNIALTAPYEHDGRFTTLLQVVSHYNQGGLHNEMQDPLIHPLNLSDAQQNDIVNFLNSLTDNNFVTRKDFTNPGHVPNP